MTSYKPCQWHKTSEISDKCNSICNKITLCAFFSRNFNSICSFLTFQTVRSSPSPDKRYPCFTATSTLHLRFASIYRCTYLLREQAIKIKSVWKMILGFFRAQSETFVNDWVVAYWNYRRTWTQSSVASLVWRNWKKIEYSLS